METKQYLKDYELKKEQKIKRWNVIMRARINWFENEYKRINNTNSISNSNKQIICKEIQLIAALELDGGKCQRCGRAWKETIFDNKFGAGRYFEPECQCYFKCPRCKKHLYDMYVTTRLKMTKYQCHFCDWVLLFEGEERHGIAYELWYDREYIKPANINLKKIEEENRKKDSKKEYKK